MKKTKINFIQNLFDRHCYTFEAFIIINIITGNKPFRL